MNIDSEICANSTFYPGGGCNGEIYVMLIFFLILLGLSVFIIGSMIGFIWGKLHEKA